MNLAIESIPFLDKLRCLTHVLNLVTKSILDENVSLQILNTVKKCRSLVCTFKHSNTLTEQLKTAMESKRNQAINMNPDDVEELPPVRKLKQDVPTR